MVWFKFGKNDSAVQTGRSRVQPPVESVEAMRQKAKFRLIGSAVLVLAGVVGFPILFDSQPRTVAIDIPIDIPDKNKVAPLAPSNAPSAAAPGAVVEDKASLSGKEEIVASSKPADKPVAAALVAKPAEQAEEKVAAKIRADKARADKASADKASADKASADKASADKASADKAAADKVKADEVKAAKAEKAERAEKAKAKLAADAEAARAKALLDGSAAKPAAAAATPSTAPLATDAVRFIVQFGAFSDAAKAQEVRQQVEKTGLKTYSQVAKTADGERIRVRVGPFTSRAEADKAAAKIKALNLPASVLTL